MIIRAVASNKVNKKNPISTQKLLGQFELKACTIIYVCMLLKKDVSCCINFISRIVKDYFEGFYKLLND